GDRRGGAAAGAGRTHLRAPGGRGRPAHPGAARGKTRKERGVKLAVLGLSLSSSWGNGHATTYRALLRAFARRGHEVLFLERDVPWYAGARRDLVDPDFCRLALYSDLAELKRVWRSEVARADAVVVGSYTPDGVDVGRWA